MSFEIKKVNEVWRIRLRIEEEWEFKTRKELEACLKNLMDYKEKFGKLKDHTYRGC